MRYLLLTYIRKPNGQIDEQVGFCKKLKLSDQQMCNVIMDYALKKIQKCVIEGKKIDKDWDTLHEYYKKIYPALISQLEKEAPITIKQKD